MLHVNCLIINDVNEKAESMVIIASIARALRGIEEMFDPNTPLIWRIALISAIPAGLIVAYFKQKKRKKRK